MSVTMQLKEKVGKDRQMVYCTYWSAVALTEHLHLISVCLHISGYAYVKRSPYPPIWSVVRIIEYRILCKSGHEKYKDCRNGDIASHNYMFYNINVHSLQNSIWKLHKWKIIFIFMARFNNYIKGLTNRFPAAIIQSYCSIKFIPTWYPHAIKDSVTPWYWGKT